MSIRMIAIDLDGTLLHDDMTISAYSREVIQKAIQKGYEIVVATGRMWDSARSKVALLRLGNVPVICYTGAWIMWSETGEPILQDGLSADLASRVMLAARERGWEVTAFWDNHIYMERPNGSEAKYQKYRTQKPQYLGEAFYHPPMTVTRVVFADPSEEERGRIRAFLESRFGEEITVVYPGDDFVDVHKKGIDKASALSFLAERRGIRPEEIMAFGNTENDVPMLRYAGVSYAVANADGVAKEAAGHICASNEEDGVAKVIEELVASDWSPGISH